MRSLLFLFFVAFTVPVFAQPKGYTPVANAAQFQQALSAHTAALQSLQADFTQTKVLALLSDKVTSKGKFSYRKADKVRLEYTQPYTYLMVMNAGKVMVRDEQKTSTMNAKSSKTLQSVNRIMLDCMSGAVFSNPDFKTTAYQSPTGYLLAMKPATPAIQKLFRSIDVFLDKNHDVTKLVLTEQGGDFTEMVFKGTVRNVALNDALFSVR